MFAFNPDDAPARLMRYVPDGVLPRGVLAVYDKANNLLVISRPLFDLLDDVQQKLTLRTHAPVIYVGTGNLGDPEEDVFKVAAE